MLFHGLVGMQLVGDGPKGRYVTVVFWVSQILQ